MNKWNILVSTYQGGYRRASRALQKLGMVENTPLSQRHSDVRRRPDGATRSDRAAYRRSPSAL